MEGGKEEFTQTTATRATKEGVSRGDFEQLNGEVLKHRLVLAVFLVGGSCASARELFA